MTYRIGVAGFSHETVSLWLGVTSLRARRYSHYGNNIIDKGRNTNGCIGCFARFGFQGCERVQARIQERVHDKRCAYTN